MYIHFESGYVFQNIPKTGSTSIRVKLGAVESNQKIIKNLNEKNDGSDHYTSDFIHKWVSPVFIENLAWFTVVRNPFDRLVSEWYWRKDRTNYPNHGSFRLWAETVFDGPKIIVHDQNHILPQIEFTKNLPLDPILRFENLDTEWNTFLGESLGALSKHNTAYKRRTTREHFEQLKTTTIQNIINYYYDDFEAFQYSKDYIRA